MALDISWPMVLGATVAYLATVASYRLFLHPLARFPGPKLAAISRWYEAYYDVVLGGQYTAKIAELHGEYGRSAIFNPFHGPQKLTHRPGQAQSFGSARTNCTSPMPSFSTRSIAWRDVGTNIRGHTMLSEPRAQRYFAQVSHFSSHCTCRL